jgi:peptidoglycan/LPS O-acetylase OafA/YrhL
VGLARALQRVAEGFSSRRFRDQAMENTIAALLQGRDNNFNLIRFVAASAVLVAHCFDVVTPEQAAAAPFNLDELGLGRIAVDVFFIVSGFLVTRSVLTQPTLADYATARVLRLFPALLVTCLCTAFVLGPLVTQVSWQAYFADPRTWLYVPATASLVTHSLTLPGVFDTVTMSGVINSPLWTLRYETFCYALLALFTLTGLFATRLRAVLLLAAICAAYLFVTFATAWREASGGVENTTRFVFDFFLGGAFYIFAGKVRLDGSVAVALLAIAAAGFGSTAFEPLLKVALAYAVLWFAFVPQGALRRFNLIGDYSYGLYILHFPIQQTLLTLDPTLTPGWLFLCSFPAALAFAILSWHFIEHPTLRQKAWAGDCVGSLQRVAQQRCAALFGLGAGPGAQETPMSR